MSHDTRSMELSEIPNRDKHQINKKLFFILKRLRTESSIKITIVLIRNCLVRDQCHFNNKLVTVLKNKIIKGLNPDLCKKKYARSNALSY